MIFFTDLGDAILRTALSAVGRCRDDGEVFRDFSVLDNLDTTGGEATDSEADDEATVVDEATDADDETTDAEPTGDDATDDDDENHDDENHDDENHDERTARQP